jgi:hypothetical protein
MTILIASRVDTNYLDAILLSDRGLIDRPPASSALATVPSMHLKQWASLHGRYTLPTAELIDWLRGIIRGRSAIEICAGHGEIGRALGIPMTDAYLHANPDIRMHYMIMQQTPTDPPSDVEKLEGVDAVRKYRPKVVIASWATQQWREGDDPLDSSPYGVDEEALWRDFGVEMYVHIGTFPVHGKKRLRKEPHDAHCLPFLFSRALNPKDNVVFVWER